MRTLDVFVLPLFPADPEKPGYDPVGRFGDPTQRPCIWVRWVESEKILVLRPGPACLWVWSTNLSERENHSRVEPHNYSLRELSAVALTSDGLHAAIGLRRAVELWKIQSPTSTLLWRMHGEEARLLRFTWDNTTMVMGSWHDHSSLVFWRIDNYESRNGSLEVVGTFAGHADKVL